MNIDEALTSAEHALDEGRSLKGTGFWRAVDEARRDRAIAERYADRMAAIDRRAFEQGVKLRVPLTTGVVGLVGASAFGIGFIRYAMNDGRSGLIDPILFLVGFGALLIGTHSLAHFVVGRLLGIRFTHIFLGGPPPPRPGVKTDYATYLRSTPAKRAAMHASGAIVTKILPFALLPFVWNGIAWLRFVLIAVGVIQIVTDVTLSTKVSDWKKVKRELSS